MPGSGPSDRFHTLPLSPWGRGSRADRVQMIPQSHRASGLGGALHLLPSEQMGRQKARSPNSSSDIGPTRMESRAPGSWPLWLPPVASLCNPALSGQASSPHPKQIGKLLGNLKLSES